MLDRQGRALFPATVTIEGRRFRRARWRERKPGVVEQYREAVTERSLHLCVLGDGSWVVDHADSVNPDGGGVAAPLRHFLADTAMGRRLAGTTVVGSVVALLLLLAARSD